MSYRAIAHKSLFQKTEQICFVSIRLPSYKKIIPSGMPTYNALELMIRDHKTIL